MGKRGYRSYINRDGFRYCTQCGIEFPLTHEYYAKSKHGFQWKCRKCVHAYNVAYKQKSYKLFGVIPDDGQIHPMVNTAVKYWIERSSVFSNQYPGHKERMKAHMKRIKAAMKDKSNARNNRSRRIDPVSCGSGTE